MYDFLRNNNITTPAYVIDEKELTNNLKILKEIQNKTNCKIFLSQKCFSVYQLYPLIDQYLTGVTASSINEAILGKENSMFVQTYSPAFNDEEFDEILNYSDTVIFNSINQLLKFSQRASAANKDIGLRINPNISTQNNPFCDPCTPGSRFGVTSEQFASSYDLIKDSITGLMFHAHSKQCLTDLVKTVRIVEEKFGDYLSKMQWISFGGGQHITNADYDVDGLIKLINHFQDYYDLIVYLEPGEAVVLNACAMVSKVLDFVENGSVKTAILDCSAFAHMPDILYLHEQPQIVDAQIGNSLQYVYRLASHTCLSGDIIGDYSFNQPLEVGDKLIIKNQAIYSIVCNNWFNGFSLPDIAIYNIDGSYEIIRSFGYADYKRNL